MEKKIGNWLILGGNIIFIIGSLLWIIFFSIFTIFSWEFYIGLVVIPTAIGLLCIIIGCILNEKKRKMGILSEKNYHITGQVFIVLGVFICLGLLLVDSPIGPPILGTSTINVGTFNGVFLFIMFTSVFMVIISGLMLLLSGSKAFLIIGLIALVIAVGVFQDWGGEIISAYNKIIGGGPPGPPI
ncbi:MAG: hypothetical protein ACFFDX_01750 [Candidatus Odinarchaeota archaeon]